MILTGPHSMMYRSLWIIFSCALMSIDARSSTFPKNKKAMCDTLPFNISDPPDVWLNAPDVSVDQISLTAKNFKTRVSLSTSVASLLSLNAGVDITMDKVNLTIQNFQGEIQLAMHLDNVAKILTRTMASLDLNPLLVKMADHSFGIGNNLLAVLTANEQIIYQIINRAGKIVNQVIGTANEILSSTIVGDYQQNMTFLGVTKILENGFIIKQYIYSLSSDNIFINIVFDNFDNVLNTYVVNSPSFVRPYD